jgi:hypothetical protein
MTGDRYGFAALGRTVEIRVRPYDAQAKAGHLIAGVKKQRPVSCGVWWSSGR